MTHAPMSEPDDDAELQGHLEDLLGGLSDDEVGELADVAEASYAEGGPE